MNISLQPVDMPTDIKIWRYMDLTKFLDLILNRNLYFRRVDKFEDPYEGFLSNTYKVNTHKSYLEISNILNISDEAQTELSSVHLNGVALMPMYAYANCWYMGEVESAAMWKLYGGNDSIAITSTVSNLKAVLQICDDEDQGVLHLQKVRYVSEESVVDTNNFLNPMFEKRLSFEYEFRALYLFNKAFLNLDITRKAYHETKDQIQNKDGLGFEIDIIKLIDNIYISPTASAKLKSLVEKVLLLAGLDNIECIQSKLYDLK